MEKLEVMPVADTQIAAIERANLDTQIDTARRYPRTLSKVKERMLSLATLDKETAASCFYTLKRGGKPIIGPSIRLAEIALSSWGNLRAGTRVLSVNPHDENPHVVIQAVAHDLETNAAIAIEKRRRITKKKNKPSPDEDDVNLAVNACSSIAMRDAVFKVVPLAVIKPVFDAAKKVAVGDAKSLATSRKVVIDRLVELGAKEAAIFAAVGARKIDDIDQDKLALLIGIGTAIKSGETTVDEEFPEPAVEREGLFKKAAATAAAPKAPEPKRPENTDGTPQSKLASLCERSGVTFDKLVSAAKHDGVIDSEFSPSGFADLSDEFCLAMLASPPEVIADLAK